jgi:hypothetical protein
MVVLRDERRERVRDGGSPLWIAEWRSGGPSSVFVEASTAGTATDLIQGTGLPRPDRLTFAGYAAVPESPDRPALPKTPPKQDLRIGRRVETALSIYSLLRVDWPIGSILQDPEAARRIPDRALRDFIAAVGSAIERVEVDTRILLEVVDAQGKAWWFASQEMNARRSRNLRLAEWAGERRTLYRDRARRLRKRRGFDIAVGELAALLEGTLPSSEEAAERFRGILITGGLSADDADSMVRRFRRVTVPRL